jgi:hypothetical protein
MLWAFPAALSALSLALTDATRREMLEFSQTGPVLVLFHAEWCRECGAVRALYADLSLLHRRNRAILTAECDCGAHPRTCELTGAPPALPGFAIVQRGAPARVAIAPTFAALSGAAGALLAADWSVPCGRFFNQSAGFPHFVFSLPGHEAQSCRTVRQLAERLPGAAGHFLLGRPAAVASVTARLSAAVAVARDGVPDLGFFRDFAVRSLGAWPLARARFVTERALALFVFASEEELRAGAAVAEAAGAWLCFARFSHAEFAEAHPAVPLPAAALPAAAVLNRRRTEFRLVRNLDRDLGGRDLRSLAAEGEAFRLNATVAARLSPRRSLGLRLALLAVPAGSLLCAPLLCPRPLARGIDRVARRWRPLAPYLRAAAALLGLHTEFLSDA